MNYWKFILLFWLILGIFIAYAYFFQPQIFNQMFGNYKGPESPFINYP